MRFFDVIIFFAALAGLSVTPADCQNRFATIYAFNGGEMGGVAAADGVLYGPGTTGNCGSIDVLEPPTAPGGMWAHNTLYVFTGLNGGGCGPVGAPAIGADGALYGITSNGGAFWGTVYRLEPPDGIGGSWTESTLYTFPSITSPFGLIIGSGGILYVGSTDGGTHDTGAIFELQPPAAPGGTWTTTVLFSFPGNLSETAPSSLSLASDGAFYGTIMIGGATAEGPGAVFQVKPPAAPGGEWTETVLYYFQGGKDGASPNSVVMGPDGNLYGTTFGTSGLDNSRGAYGIGTVFELSPPASPGAYWTKATLAQLSAGDLRGPNSPLLLRNGKLYGSSSSGPSNPGGVVYELTPPATPGGAWTTSVLHSFAGTVPGFSLVLGQNGTLYGTTQAPFPEPPQGVVYRIALQ